MLDCIKIGQKICRLRTNQQMNQEELAHLLYVSRQAVSRWEVGDAMPSIDNVVELSKIQITYFKDIIVCLSYKRFVRKK